VDDKHHIYGTPLAPIDAKREVQERGAMLQPPYVMSEPEREIVCNAIVELARERGWLLWAVHVRTDHVHVVVSAERDPGRVMSDMKARGSRDLTLAGFGNAARRRWTRHGSTLHLFHEEEVAAKIAYTLDQQGERMAWYAKEPRTQ
jgi:REP element-mobilizing transposase RayT